MLTRHAFNSAIRVNKTITAPVFCYNSSRARIFRGRAPSSPSRRPNVAASSPPISTPVLSDQNTWNGVFPDADNDLEATSEYSREGLEKILNYDTLIVTRQVEMLNIFLGFEQANRYAIMNTEGHTVGFIAEQQRSFLWTLGRQLFRTNRPVRAIIMDTSGFPLLWIRRPFQIINSRLYAERRTNESEGKALETFGEVQQIWHPWRRKYDLFMRKSGNEHSLSTDLPTADSPDHIFTQFARIDGGLFAWHFVLQDARGEEIASVERGFRGWGRELFTDTGQYTVRFTPAPLDPTSPTSFQPPETRHLTVDERALVLALSFNVDVDYFSRHSERGVGLYPWLLFGGGDE